MGWWIPLAEFGWIIARSAYNNDLPHTENIVATRTVFFSRPSQTTERAPLTAHSQAYAQ